MWNLKSLLCLVLILSKLSANGEEYEGYDDEDDYDEEYFDQDLASSEVKATTPSFSSEISSTSTVETTTPTATTPEVVTRRVLISKAPKILTANLADNDQGELDDDSTMIEIPDNCNGYKMLPMQPAKFPVVPIPKCCRPGENYFFGEQENRCGEQQVEFNFSVIHAVFHNGCIEDTEAQLEYEIVNKPPCEK